MTIYKYLVESEYFTDDFIKSVFDKRGNWKQDETPDFLFTTGESYTDKKYYNMKIPLKNGINDKKILSIKYKNELNILMDNNKLKKYKPATYNIDISKKDINDLEQYKKLFDNNKVYICKIANMGMGINIQIVQTYNEFLKFLISFIELLKKKPHLKMTDFVLQEYITNPLLITINGNKYKFHIRHYFIYHHKYACYMKKAKFTIAKKPFVNTNYNDKDIHDTHFHGKLGYIWPNDAHIPDDKMKLIDKQIDDFYRNLVKVYKPSCYPENKECFEIFGCDFMITNDYKLIVIEINFKIGMSKIINNITAEINKDIFNSLMYYVVDKLYPPKNKQSDPKTCIYLNFNK